MTIAVVQSASAQTSVLHTTQTATFPGTPTSGNTIALALSIASGVTQKNINIPAGWTQRLLYWDGTHTELFICTRVAGAAEPTGVTVTFDIAGRSALVIWEVNGAYGGLASAYAISATQAIPSLTPTAAIEALLVPVALAHEAYAITSQPSGYTSVAEAIANDGGSDKVSVWYKHVASTSGSYTGSISYSSSVMGNKAHLLFVAAAPVVIAAFSGTPVAGAGPLTVTFTDATSESPTSWAWTFGDSGTSTSQNPTHVYAPGTYTVALTATNASGSDVETKTAYIVVSPPGVGIEWDATIIDVSADIREWTITRGAPPELTGGSSPGSATILLKNPADKYNPENAGGPYHGFLHDGPRVWIGINTDGTIAYDAAKTIAGLFAGRITDLSVLPGEGTTVAPFVELVCEDPLGWFSRQNVRLPDSTTRSQADLRFAVLDALQVQHSTLPPEPTTMPLSSADGLALNILDDINRASGTRHFAKPATNPTDWYTYTAVRRTDRLDGTSDASLSAASQHVTGTSGWRISADGIINRQKATVAEVSFPARIVVWQADTLPLTVVSGTDQTIWATFGDYVGSPEASSTSTGSGLTVTLTPFGDTAKVVLSSAGTTTITALDIRGYLVQRGSDASVVIDDATSQAKPRGVRAGPDLSGDYLGTLTAAEGFARHIVWRFGNELYRPTLTVENWFPQMFTLDLFDRIAFTSSQLGITARIFEIVGLTHHGLIAGASAVYHTVVYTLQESRVQTATAWFTLDSSLLDGAALLAY